MGSGYRKVESHLEKSLEIPKTGEEEPALLDQEHHLG